MNLPSFNYNPLAIFVSKAYKNGGGSRRIKGGEAINQGFRIKKICSFLHKNKAIVCKKHSQRRREKGKIALIVVAAIAANG